MLNLANQRCFNHAGREAVARCPECHNFFCRECITEHDDRVVCSACLAKLAHVPFVKRPAFAVGVRLARCLFGMLVAWFFFYMVGEILLKIPSSFHEGTIWRTYPMDQE